MGIGVYGADYFHPSQQVLNSIYGLRHKVFKERLDWEVNSRDGLERDEFDDEQPVYLAYHGQSGDVIGCVRLLPTTGPNMIRDVFPDLSDEPIPAKTKVWEVSRFGIEMDDAALLGAGNINAITYSLVAGIHEVGLDYAITHMVAVMDVRIERILRRAGCVMRRIGKPRRMGNCVALAVEFEVSRQALADIRRNGGLVGRVAQYPMAQAA
ncbi:MAG: GNAT family N-acetyltransferase [Rhodospirillaceae bacterium]|nr:GNAT family N-acetyltransferase [Rhodospirillales bacterium]